MKTPNKYVSIIFVLAILYLLYEVAMPSRKAKDVSGAKRTNTKIQPPNEVKLPEKVSIKKSIKKLLERDATQEEESLKKKERTDTCVYI